MKKLIFVVVLSVAALLCGMGERGGPPEGALPKTEENFRVRLIDRSGQSLELEQFSFKGKVFLEGEVGKGQLTVPFRNIRKMTFAAPEGELVPVDLQLRAGSAVRLQLQGGDLFYGSPGYGTFQIRGGDVQSIDFL
ncbi:hypothetical protein DESUT3_23750 [Desulfuromonas versatilis]|uniref:Uncharacterized protein n=1 Tax=Desulfuromonas versatilis TaxID=2802975 RepID=A0ABM8HXJ0_9BACT|nr:hypothetical protein [Desulfuromonas versatilis]BCR05306.1 hypothetical protein DESUT3_23750 [Desulfuromonas versatilis]